MLYLFRFNFHKDKVFHWPRCTLKMASSTTIARATNNGDGSPLLDMPCQMCGVPCKTRCSGCNKMYYCNYDHQVAHWNDGHKNECNLAKTGVNPPKVTPPPRYISPGRPERLDLGEDDDDETDPTHESRNRIKSGALVDSVQFVDAIQELKEPDTLIKDVVLARTVGLINNIHSSSRGASGILPMWFVHSIDKSPGQVYRTIIGMLLRPNSPRYDRLERVSYIVHSPSPEHWVTVEMAMARFTMDQARRHRGVFPENPTVSRVTVYDSLMKNNALYRAALVWNHRSCSTTVSSPEFTQDMYSSGYYEHVHATVGSLVRFMELYAYFGRHMDQAVAMCTDMNLHGERAKLFVRNYLRQILAKHLEEVVPHITAHKRAMREMHENSQHIQTEEPLRGTRRFGVPYFDAGVSSLWVYEWRGYVETQEPGSNDCAMYCVDLLWNALCPNMSMAVNTDSYMRNVDRFRRQRAGLVKQDYVKRYFFMLHRIPHTVLLCSTPSQLIAYLRDGLTETPGKQREEAERTGRLVAPPTKAVPITSKDKGKGPSRNSHNMARQIAEKQGHSRLPLIDMTEEDGDQPMDANTWNGELVYGNSDTDELKFLERLEKEARVGGANSVRRVEIEKAREHALTKYDTDKPLWMILHPMYEFIAPQGDDSEVHHFTLLRPSDCITDTNRALLMRKSLRWLFVSPDAGGLLLDLAFSLRQMVVLMARLVIMHHIVRHRTGEKLGSIVINIPAENQHIAKGVVSSQDESADLVKEALRMFLYCYGFSQHFNVWGMDEMTTKEHESPDTDMWKDVSVLLNVCQEPCPEKSQHGPNMFRKACCKVFTSQLNNIDLTHAQRTALQQETQDWAVSNAQSSSIIMGMQSLNFDEKLIDSDRNAGESDDSEDTTDLETIKNNESPNKQFFNNSVSPSVPGTSVSGPAANEEQYQRTAIVEVPRLTVVNMVQCCPEIVVSDAQNASIPQAMANEYNSNPLHSIDRWYTQIVSNHNSSSPLAVALSDRTEFDPLCRPTQSIRESFFVSDSVMSQVLPQRFQFSHIPEELLYL